ncbi:twin-arginine translocation signal domain-containing protein [Mycobacterium alsense]|uniref:Twin-arginine translocation signal domain-containing protein n=3 Tax=Mycobacterium alsense TaxID=324058 RepID=A0AA41XQY1_9MYCO|nr:twin-arginine translocation signal domain-containing protein [Mycobacterium alsense]MCV7379637.1 twin-arginine translocation signal domain-containing protein [Mycobacterium alsense]
MSSAAPVTNRRGVLAGAAALAALGVVASACGESPPKPPPVENLLGPLDQARKDSALASAAAAAVGTPPQIAAALTVVATQRTAHARALSTEIARAAGKLTSSSSETTSPSSPSAAPPPGPPPPPPPVSDVIDALHASADAAGRLVTTESGYRAGLLASIAASCTASYQVALVPGGPSI